jgi:hypothetical protein
MPIDSKTLERWAGYENGAIKSAQATHQRIRKVLNAKIAKRFDDFLQGSYANYTIVRGSSDVDIVAKLTDSIRVDLSNLSDEEKRAWRAQQTEPDYSWYDFREDVLDTLRSNYGRSAVQEGEKAIEIDTDSLPLPADVLVCQRYLRYYSYPDGYHEGVVFFTIGDNEKIVNYPRLHMENGSTKEEKTGKRYKETVRIFKRARNYLVTEAGFDKETAPSYFIENLLYNVPEDRYVHDKQERIYEILTYLNNSDYSEWMCQNGIVPIFAGGETGWSLRSADTFIDDLTDLWNDW